MALPFENETIISSNPFLDILMKNLKILAYNCIIKDEYEANRKETSNSFALSELYIACIENNVSLGMFSAAGITIPDNILYSVFKTEEEKKIIKLYKNFGNSIEWIPKDVKSDDITASQFPKTNYREQLLIRLKTWFLQTYEEKNEYYRMICGLPSLKSWGIPIRDYLDMLPTYIKESYKGDFLHELDSSIINELNDLGILDIIRMEYPDEKYLLYLPAMLDLYEVRKKSDMHILWMPSDSIINKEIKKEFENKYNERREFVIKTLYTSAMEIESDFYHSIMIIYILIMTILDIIAELQQHIIRKDILDRRCVEYLFSQKGVTYYKDIPYKYQEKLCNNLHSLIKFKGSTKDLLSIKSIFGFDNDSDIKIYQYYLMKIRNYTKNGDFIIDGNTSLVSELNNILNHYVEYQDFSEDIEEIDNVEFVSENGNLKFTCIRKEMFYPYNDYEYKSLKLLISADGKLLKEGKDYIFDCDNGVIQYVKIKKNIIDNSNNIIYDYYVNESLTKDTNVSSKEYNDIQIKMIPINNYSNRHSIPITEVFPFSYNYLYLNDKLWITIDNYWPTKELEIETINLKKTESDIESGTYSIKININNIEEDISIIKVKNKDDYYILQKTSNKSFDIYQIEITNPSTNDEYIITNYKKHGKNGYFCLKEENNNIYWIIPNDIKENDNNSEYKIEKDESTETYKIYKNNILFYETEKDTYEITSQEPRLNGISYTIEKIDIDDKNIDSLSCEIYLLIGNYWLNKELNRYKESFIIKLTDSKSSNNINNVKKDNTNTDNYLISLVKNNYRITKNNDSTNDYDLNYTLISKNNEFHLEEISINKYKKEFNLLNSKNSNILEIDGDINLKNKDIYIIYLESEKADIRYYKKEIPIKNKNNLIFTIPEPFPYYIDNKNKYYISLTKVIADSNGDYIKSSKILNETSYEELDMKLDEKGLPKYSIKITDEKIIKSLKIKKNNLKVGEYYHTLGFNFVYSADNIINDFKLEKSYIDIIPQYYNQIEFPIKKIFKQNNIDNVCALYINYNNKYFDPNTQFSYNDKTIIFDDSIGIHKIDDIDNKPIKLEILYLTKNRKNLQYNNICISKQILTIDKISDKAEFDLNVPIENYINYIYNEIIIDIMGKPIHINYDNNIKEGPTNYKLILSTMGYNLNDIINVTYIYNNISNIRIVPKLIELNIKENKNSEYVVEDIENTKINIDLSNDTIKFTDKLINNSNSFEIISCNKLANINNIQYIEINENNYTIQKIILQNLSNFLNQSFLNNSNIFDILYFYLKDENVNISNDVSNDNVNNNDNDFIYKNIKISKEDLINDENRKLFINILKDKDVELPMDYFDNQWPYYITYKNGSNETILLSEEYYDLIDGYFYLYTDKNIELENIIEFEFTFIYLIKNNYIYKKYLEKYDNNIQLEFCQVPIGEDISVVEYLADQKNWKDYNSVISSDNWWNGLKHKSNYISLLKDQIYQKEFNVIRTKYYSLSQEDSFNKYTVQASFFYSMLYDNVFKFNLNEKILNESDMKLYVPSISTYNKFLISHLFLYIMCLSSIYNNKELSTLRHSDNLNPIYTIGFNFSTSLNELKNELRNEFLITIPDTQPDDKESMLFKLYNVLNNFDFGTNKISNNIEYSTDDSHIFKRFIEIYNNNKEVYEIICKYIIDSETITEFTVWNYIYYKLMTWKYDSSYFKIQNDTKLAETYEEFLKDKSEILYNNLQSIKNIYDSDTKIDIITDYIEEIETVLSRFLNPSGTVKDEDTYQDLNFIIKIYTGNFSNLKISYMKKILDFFKSYKIHIKDVDTNITFDDSENIENSYRIYEKIIFTDNIHLSEYCNFDENIEIKTISNNKEIDIEYIRT